MPALALGGTVAKTSTPTFSGTSEANDEILLLEGNSIIGSGMATPGGTWTIAASIPLGLGYHTVSAQSVDQAGNLGPASAGVTIEVETPPAGQVTLNDTTMINAHAMSVIGTVHDSGGGTLTEYGSATFGGYQLTNQSRSGFSFVTWDAAWSHMHQAGNTDEYYDGQNVLIVPTNGIIAPGGAGFNPVASAVADTIDLKRTDGAAFSLVSIDVGPTGNAPTFGVFTGTTASGQTIVQTVELVLAQNSTVQPVALTGFNDVTDVKFTESFSGNGDPTSVQFDNIVVGNPTVPQAPTTAPFTASVTLDDASIVAAGQVTLKSSDINVGRNMSYRYYGPAAVNGFAITNLDRTDFALFSFDSNFASVNGDFYDGPDVFIAPFGNTGNPSRIQIQRPDGVAFGITSIALDSIFATGNGSTMSATFTGTTVAGNTVTQTFQLDNAQGLQTFQFNASFGSLKSLQFAGTANLLFNGITLVPTVAPSLAVGSMGAANRGQSIPISNLAAALDPSNVGFSKLELWHSVGPADGSQLVVNGAPQTTGHEIDLSPADVANTVFNVGSGGTDTLWARLLQNDGSLTPWQSFTVTAAPDHTPVVTAPDYAASHGQNIAVASLFSVIDGDGDSITACQFWDSTPDAASGHWVVGGAPQGAGVAIDVTPVQLTTATFQSGSGSDHVWVRANDGTAWGDWTGFFVNAPPDNVPVVHPTSATFSATHGQNIAANSLFSVSDLDNTDTVTAFQFWDSTADPSSGHWVVGGTPQGAGVTIDVTPVQFASATFQSGSGSDHVWVRANDGIAWGPWQDFNINAPDNLPVVHPTSANFSATHNLNVAATSLFTVSDLDGSDTVTAYQFWDSTADQASGHWVVGGQAQGAGVAIDVTPTQFSTATFQSGSGSDHVWVRANDGIAWGAWQDFNVNGAFDQAPVVSGNNTSLTLNTGIAVSGLFGATDAEHDPITQFELWDSTNAASNGHFLLNGAVQPVGQGIFLDSTQFNQTSFVASSTPTTDRLWARAYDGNLWSDWTAANVTSHA